MITDLDRDEQIIDRYKTRYRFQDAIFRMLRIVSRSLPVSNQFPIDKFSIKKILIANGGHIGDIVISTALLPILQEAIPEVSIGFLAGSYSRSILEGHPSVARLHLLDHWYLTRTKNKFIQFWKFQHEIQRTVRELQAERYDLAIDLRAWFPNFTGIMHRAGIPISIGYDRVAQGQTLTHSFKYQYDRRHELQHQLDLLKPLNIDPNLIAEAWPYLLPPTGKIPAQIEALLDTKQKFCILHPASSTPTRDWPQQNWIQLAQNLVGRSIVPVITGRGQRDAAIANEISAAVPSAINLCNQLPWNDLVSVIREADAVYSVETSIGHVASAFKKPVIAIYGGMADPHHWAPLGAKVVTNLTPCHPCFKKAGCSHRSCLTDITVEQVEKAAMTVIDSNSNMDKKC